MKHRRTPIAMSKFTASQLKKIDAELDAAWGRVGTYTSEKRASLESGARKPTHAKPSQARSS